MQKNTRSNSNPLVSIIMPVRNSGLFLLEALQSIKNQTYTNWELIVVDDASTDETSNILKDFSKASKKIKIYGNKRKKGVSVSANIAISKARGEFVARMDSDDVMYPNRIEKQVKFLLKNKSVVAVGGQCGVINECGEEIGEKIFPTSSKEIEKKMFSNIPVQQPTLMVNMSMLPKDFVWYDDSIGLAEEMELLFKLFECGEVRNVPGKVLRYRIHGGNTSLQDPKKTFYQTFKTRLISLYKYKYKPTILGVLTTIVQLIVVSVLPKNLIYPTYSFVRGLNKINILFLQRIKIAYNN